MPCKGCKASDEICPLRSPCTAHVVVQSPQTMVRKGQAIA